MAKEEALRCAEEDIPGEPEELRRLDHRARVVLGLFAKTGQITSADVSRVLGLSQRMVRVLLSEWVKEGWLEVTKPSNRARAYTLSEIYRQHLKVKRAKAEEYFLRILFHDGQRIRHES